jgi:hypothetical protein
MSWDDGAIEISRCPIRNGIIEMEESAPGTRFRPILRALFIKIGPEFLSKEFTIKYFCGGDMTTLSVPECEKQTQLIIFAPINDRRRFGFAMDKLVHMDDRALSGRVHVSSPGQTFSSRGPGFDSRNSRSFVES